MRHVSMHLSFRCRHFWTEPWHANKSCTSGPSGGSWCLQVNCPPHLPTHMHSPEYDLLSTLQPTSRPWIKSILYMTVSTAQVLAWDLQPPDHPQISMHVSILSDASLCTVYYVSTRIANIVTPPPPPPGTGVTLSHPQ